MTYHFPGAGIPGYTGGPEGRFLLVVCVYSSLSETETTTDQNYDLVTSVAEVNIKS